LFLKQERECVESLAWNRSLSIPLSTPQALQNFAHWVATIRGDEDSEAQTYVNRLLQAWGWADSVEAATTFERKNPQRQPCWWHG